MTNSHTHAVYARAFQGSAWVLVGTYRSYREAAWRRDALRVGGYADARIGS